MDCEGAIGIEKSFEPWMRHHLLDTVLPSLDGVSSGSSAGVTVDRHRLRRRAARS